MAGLSRMDTISKLDATSRFDGISKLSQMSRMYSFTRKNVDDYRSLEEILVEVEKLSRDNFLIAQTNEVLERYLRKRTPNLLLGLEKYMDSIGPKASVVTGRSLSINISRDNSPLTITSPTFSSSLTLASRSMKHSPSGANRINILFRIEMVERELEEGKMTMNKLRKRFESAKFLLQTEEENLRCEEEMAQENKMLFENFISESTDKKTGRVLHDKFLRFLETELQSKDRELRKMKLRTKTYQIEYNRMKSQQQQKLELREQLHPVDLDKLQVENQEQLQLLEQKIKHLLDLKRAVGKKGQNLVLTKSRLNDTTLSLKNITEDIKQKEERYTFTDLQESKNLNDLMAAELLNQSIKKLNSTYRSPDVHSYLKMEVKLDDLKREMETWKRRCQNQKQTLNLLEHQLRQILPPDVQSRSTVRFKRSIKTIFSSRSADSMLKPNQKFLPFPHCTPTTPI